MSKENNEMVICPKHDICTKAKIEFCAHSKLHSQNKNCDNHCMACGMTGSTKCEINHDK